MLGPHLIMDLYECNIEKISDPNYIYKILDELPDIIGMKKLDKPRVYIVPPNPQSFDKGGVSGYVIIAESHIAIHTFKREKFVSIDLFSCKDFDIETAENYFIEKLEPKKVDKHVLPRGRQFIKEYD